MINKVFNCIDKIIADKKINSKIEDKISKKEEELGIKIPDILKEFYIRYSGNKSILSSFYILKNIDQLKIEEDVLIIGYSNQFIDKYGIRIDELTTDSYNIKVNLATEKGEWTVYESLDDFIINTAVFQVINMLEASVQLDASEITIEEFFVPLNKIDNKNYNIISYISKDEKILASHFISDNIIYFGSDTDEILEEFEEHADVEFDWL